MKIIIHCCLCEKKYEQEINSPSGWSGVEYLEEEWAFCPDHAVIEEFSNSQCPGCVGGWGDCGLWTGFAYERRRNLTEADLGMIRVGVCPRRVNGTLTFNSTDKKLMNVDLSEKASTDSGTALEKSIRDYWVKYPEKL